jgi:hypothetical protein
MAEPEPVKDFGESSSEILAPNSSDGTERAAQTASRRCRDPIWLVIFLIHLCLIFMVAGIYGKKFVDDFNYHDENPNDTNDENTLSTTDQKRIIAILAISAIVGTVFGAIWLEVLKRCASNIIRLSFVLNCMFLAVGAVLAFAAGVMIMGVVYVIALVFALIYYYMIRRRIPFTQAVLEASVKSIQDFNGPVFVTYIMALLQVAWFAFWGFTFAAVYHDSQVDKGHAEGDQKNTSGSSLNGFAYFYLLVSLYWTTEVLKNIAHVTTAGVVATWWLDPTNKSPTCGALARASTTSLGSICLGSLIVAILQAFREIVRVVQDNAKRSQNTLAACVLCFVDCILRCVEGLIRYFNHYAYTQVAIYGKSFISAARDTWYLFKRCGLDAVVNDDLTGMVLGLGALMGGVVTGLMAALWAVTFGVSNVYIVVGLLGFVIGFVMVLLMMNVVQSAVATTFVIWAEDPAGIERTRPDQARKIRTAAEGLYVVHSAPGSAFDRA